MTRLLSKPYNVKNSVSIPNKMLKYVDKGYVAHWCDDGSIIIMPKNDKTDFVKVSKFTVKHHCGCVSIPMILRSLYVGKLVQWELSGDIIWGEVFDDEKFFCIGRKTFGFVNIEKSLISKNYSNLIELFYDEYEKFYNIKPNLDITSRLFYEFYKNLEVTEEEIVLSKKWNIYRPYNLIEIAKNHGYKETMEEVVVMVHDMYYGRGLWEDKPQSYTQIGKVFDRSNQSMRGFAKKHGVKSRSSGGANNKIGNRKYFNRIKDIANQAIPIFDQYNIPKKNRTSTMALYLYSLHMDVYVIAKKFDIYSSTVERAIRKHS